MSVIANLPTGSTLITAAKIEAALGYVPVDPAKLPELAVTGITFGTNTQDVKRGIVNITLASLGIEKVENKSAEDILAELTREDVETLLGNTDYSEDESNGIYDLVVEIRELLGMDEADGTEESLLERVQKLEEAVTALQTETARLETAKMDKSAFTKEAVEKLLGNTDYSAEANPANGILDQIKSNDKDIKDLQDKDEELEQSIDDIKEALGLDDEGDESGTSILDRLEAVEGKADQNEQDIADIKDALGLGDDTDSDSPSILDRLDTVEKGLGLDDDYDPEEDGTLLDRIKGAEANIEQNTSDIADNKGNIAQNASDIEEIEKALGIEDGYENAKDIVTRLGEVETQAKANKEKSEQNASDIKEIQDTLGDLELEEEQTLADVIQDLKDKDDELESSIGENAQAIEDINDKIGDLNEDTTIADLIKDLEEQIENNQDSADDTFLKKDDFTREAILEKIAKDVESSNDDTIKYTLPENKWAVESGDTGFYVAKITAEDLEVETLEDVGDIELLLDSTASYVQVIAVTESIITGYEQTDDYFTIHAINKPYADIPFVVILDRHEIAVEED